MPRHPLTAGLNKSYTAALRMGKGGDENVLEQAKVAAEDYLAHFPLEWRGAILLGVLASVYGKENGGFDTAVWLAGNELGQESLDHRTIVALREIGVLDELIVTNEGLVVYPVSLDIEA